MAPKVFLSCVALALMLAAPAATAETLSFQQLKERPEARLVTEEFLDAALAGDPLGMVVTAHLLDLSGERALAMDLLETIWRDVGYRPDEVGPRPRPLRGREGKELELSKEDLLGRYHDLATYRLDEADDPAALERAFRILVENARQGFGLSAGQMGMALGKHALLPRSFELSMAWYQLGSDGTKFDLDSLTPTYHWEPPTPPHAEDFADCPEPFDRLKHFDRILAELDRTETAIREQPGQAEALAEAFRSSLAEWVGSGWAGPGQFGFSHIPVPSLLVLLLESGAPEGTQFLLDPPGLIDFQIAAEWHGQPIALSLALLDRELGRAGFRCANEWVRSEPGASEAPPEPFRLMPRPLLKGDPGKTERQQFVWSGGVEFEGVLEGGYPSGEGRLLLHRPWSGEVEIQSGAFRRGLRHGEAEARLQDGTLMERGHYRMGKLHGQGWRRVRHWDGDMEIQGEYVDGVLVQGEGRRSLPSADDKPAAIEYTGPFVADAPHGIGQCRASGISYRCRFHKGHFVGIGDTLLVP